MYIRTALTLSALLVAVAAHAQSNFAGFVNGDGTVVFTRTTNSISAIGTLNNFELNGSNYQDVAFVFTSTGLDSANPSNLSSDAFLDAGSFSFSKNGTNLLTATFRGATIEQGRLYAADGDDVNPTVTPSNGNNITFSGQAISSTTSFDDSFGFSFSDYLTPPTPGAYTASFNAKGTVQAVPEPATMAALGLGAATLLRRRRR